MVANAVIVAAVYTPEPFVIQTTLDAIREAIAARAEVEGWEFLPFANCAALVAGLNEILARRGPICGLHLVAHASQNAIFDHNSQPLLAAPNCLRDFAVPLWPGVFAPDAEIYLNGCHTGCCPPGKTLDDSLAQCLANALGGPVVYGAAGYLFGTSILGGEYCEARPGQAPFVPGSLPGRHQAPFCWRRFEARTKNN